MASFKILQSFRQQSHKHLEQFLFKKNALRDHMDILSLQHALLSTSDLDNLVPQKAVGALPDLHKLSNLSARGNRGQSLRGCL